MKYIVELQSTTDTAATTHEAGTVTDTTNLTDPVGDGEYYTPRRQVGGRVKRFTSITDAVYRKPVGGSAQDHYTVNDVRKQLRDHVALKNDEDKQLLKEFPPFRVWVRYYNNVTKQFRTGGLLTKVVYPDYIILANVRKNVTWSVQIRDCTFYVHNSALERLYDETTTDHTVEPLVDPMNHTLHQTGGKTNVIVKCDTSESTTSNVRPQKKRAQQPETTTDTTTEITESATEETDNEELIKEKLFQLYMQGRLASKPKPI